jgi:hypothetical protein
MTARRIPLVLGVLGLLAGLASAHLFADVRRPLFASANTWTGAQTFTDLAVNGVCNGCGTGGVLQVQDESSNLTIRAKLNFLGPGVTVTDNAGAGATDVTIAATPSGSDTQIQFNDGGSFGGDSGLTFDKATGTVALVGAVATSPHTTTTTTPSVTGLDDVTFSGVGLQDLVVTIDGEGTPDTFTWTVHGVTQATGVAAAATVALANGVHVHFAATTGHTLNDAWTFDTLVTGGLAEYSAVMWGGFALPDARLPTALDPLSNRVTGLQIRGFYSDLPTLGQEMVSAEIQTSTYDGGLNADSMSALRLQDACDVASGSLVNCYGLHVVSPTADTTTATNKYSIRIENVLSLASAVTNNVGLSIADVTGGSATNYAIKTGAGLVDFGDALTVTGVNVTGSDNANPITLTGGNSVDGNAGSITLTAGTSAAATSGNITLTAGGSNVTTNGGEIRLTTPDGVGSSGQIILSTGSSSHVNGVIGEIGLWGGHATAGVTPGGYVELVGGNAVDGQGGSIYLTAGTASGLGPNGDIIISSGGALTINGTPGVTASGTSCTITAIDHGIITGATCS